MRFFRLNNFVKLCKTNEKVRKNFKKLCNYDIIDSDNKTTSRQLESEGVL